jgi:hypothetical protein
VAKPLTHYPKFKGLNPAAAGTGKANRTEKNKIKIIFKVSKPNQANYRLTANLDL